MKNQRGFSPIIIVAIVAVALLGVAGAGYFGYKYFMPKIVAPAGQNQESTSNNVNQNAKIESFKIIPSQNSGEGVVYQKGAKAIVIGQNLSEVKFYQRGGGTNIYISPEGNLIGNASKISENQWELSSLPSEKLMREFCAIGLDKDGKKVNEACLFNVWGSIELTKTKNTYNALYAEQLALNTKLSRCAGLYKAIVEEGSSIYRDDSAGYDEPVWDVYSESPIEEVDFIVGQNSGKILKIFRQVFDTQCLLSEATGQKIVFCCGCINNNPLCESKTDITFYGQSVANQIKTMLGEEKLKNIPQPGACEEVVNIYYKNTCYASRAIEKCDYTICNNISDSQLKYTCYLIIADIKQDRTICDNIDKMSALEIKNKCYQYIKQF
jgi:hypothetical protein